MGRLYDAFVEVGPKFTGFGDIKQQGDRAGREYGKALAASAAKAAAADVRKLGEALAKARLAEADATGTVRAAEAKLNAVRGSAATAAEKVKSVEKALADLRKNGGSAKAVDIAEQTLRKARDAEAASTARATKEEEALASAQRKSATAADAAKKAATGLGEAQAKAAKLAEGAGKQTGNRFTRAFSSAFNPKDVEGKLSRINADKSGRSVGTKFGNGFKGAFSGVMGKAGGVFAGLALGAGLLKVGKDAVQLEATFSQTMNTMAAVAKVPASGIKDLSALAIKMGADTTFSAAEAATAMLELAKGGLSAATIQSGALQGTLTLAAAGGTDLATAATIASNALNTFGLQGKDMASVAAALAGGANASSASVESLGEALSQVGPGAKTAGLTLQDTVGVLSAFDNAGIKGSDAGTSLKTMLTRLVPTTTQAATAMKDLGLKFTDANGAFLPITNVAQQLKEKLGKLSAEQKTTALSTIFGSDATRAATVLMNEGSAGITKYIAATKDQAAASDVATARMAGTAGAMESFKGSVETAKLQLGLFSAPAIQGGLKGLTKIVNGIAPAFQKMAPLFGTIRTGLAGFGSALKGEGVTSTGFTGIMERLGVAARAAFGFFKTEVLPRLREFGGYVKSTILPIVGDLVQDKLAKMGAMFTSIKGAIKGNGPELTKLGEALKAVGKFLIENAIPAFEKLQNNVFPAVGLGASILIKTISALVAVITGTVHTSITVFDALKTAVTASVSAVGTAFSAVGSAVSTAVSAIGNAAGAVAGALKTGFSAAVGFVSSVWGQIVAAVSGPLNVAIAVATGIWSRITPILVLPFYIAKSVISNVFAGIQTVFLAAVSWVSGTFAAAWARVSGWLSGPVAVAKAAIDKVWSGIVAAFTAAKNWAVGTFAAGWAVVRDKVVGPLNAAKTLAVSKWADIKTAFTAAKNWALTTFAASWAKLKTLLTVPIDQGRKAITTILGGAKGGIQFAFKQAVSAIGTIWHGLETLAKAPISFVLKTVLNGGLIDGFNWVANLFKAPTIAHIPIPKGFAEGGYFTGRLPGPPSAVDNLLGYAKGGQAFGLAGGEFVVNAKQTAKNLPLLQAVNGGEEGFAGGGLFGGLKDAVTKGWSAGKSFVGAAADFLAHPIDFLKNKFAGAMGKLGEIGGSGIAQIVKAMPQKVYDTILTGAKSLLGFGGDLAGTMAFGRSQVGKPYVWGAAGPNGYDCSGFVSALINFAKGRNPYSRLGATGSMPWAEMAPGTGPFMVGWFQGNPGHTAATINGVNFESAGGVGVRVGGNARGANDALFTNREKVKGFASGGQVGDAPYDLLSPHGRQYIGADAIASLGRPNLPNKIRERLHELHLLHLAHQAHTAHLTHLNHRGGRFLGGGDIAAQLGLPKGRVLLRDMGGPLPHGSFAYNNSGKTETVVPGGGTMTVQLSNEDRELLRGLRDIPLVMDGRRLDQGMARRAVVGGY
jgi:TP901 family phage tail tape measure protein